jgi:hypothetical protein
MSCGSKDRYYCIPSQNRQDDWVVAPGDIAYCDAKREVILRVRQNRTDPFHEGRSVMGREEGHTDTATEDSGHKSKEVLAVCFFPFDRATELVPGHRQRDRHLLGFVIEYREVLEDSGFCFCLLAEIRKRFFVLFELGVGFPDRDRPISEATFANDLNGCAREAKLNANEHAR